MDYVGGKIQELRLLPPHLPLLRGEYSQRSGLLAIVLAAGIVVLIAYFLPYSTGTTDVCVSQFQKHSRPWPPKKCQTSRLEVHEENSDCFFRTMISETNPEGESKRLREIHGLRG
jgi:hypothetical protein